MRARGGERTVSGVAKLIGTLLAAGTAYIAARQLPSMWRYLRILRAAKSRSRANRDLRAGPDKPEYAQAPRRAGADDGDKGRRRRAASPSALKRPVSDGEMHPPRAQPSH
jgi:hypothetical protein